MLHAVPHPLAGRTVTLNDTTQDPTGRIVPGIEFRIEDFWDRVTGVSWKDAVGNPAAIIYALRSAGYTPMDDEVVYGKIGGFGHIVHVSELGTEIIK